MSFGFDLEDEEEEPAVVIDSGSALTKAGFAGSDTPIVFPSIIGRLKKKSIGKSTFIGKEAITKRDILTLKHPIQFGTVVDWNDMETLWQHTFTNVFSIASKDSSVLLTEPPLNPLKNRETMTQIMMEKFGAARFYVSISGVLAQYASGRGTGIVLESGGGVTHTVPIYEGYVLPHAVGKSNICGNEINEYLEILLRQKTNNNYQLNTIIDIKETLCEVALNENEFSNQTGISYQLPDGKIIEIGLERFTLTETLFKPEMVFGSNVLYKMSDINRSYLVNGFLHRDVNKQLFYGDVTNLIGEYTKKKEMNEGIHELVYKSIMKCDVDIRSILFHNIILCGGNTMFKGLAERLHEEMKLLRMHTRFKIIAPPERKYSVWIGGSILASLSTFEEMWITKNEYNEYGPKIVHRRCT